LLNKKTWENSIFSDISNEKDDSATSSLYYSKIFLEIIEIFHFLMDFRQNYFMSNIVEMFFRRVCKGKNLTGINLFESDHVRKAAIKTVTKDFRKVLPNSAEFTRMTPNVFPSFDQMYQNKRFDEFRRAVIKMSSNNDMHEKISFLLLDAFNVSTNIYLKQITLTLI